MIRKIYAALDIGADGGFAFMDDNQKIVGLYPIPKIKAQVDYNALFRIFYKYKDAKVIIALEDVHSIFGMSAKSNFSFGHIKGVKTGFTVAMAELFGWRYVMVQPKEWQKRIWTNSDKIYKPKKKNAKTNRKQVDTKATSLMAAKRLFPVQDFLRTPKCKNPHDGLVDAALIAQYLYYEYR